MNDEYEAIAPFYDASIGPFLRTVRKEIAAAIKGNRCLRVLDLCCGTGEQSELLASQGVWVVGVDLSSAMLRVATRRKPRRSLYFQGDATQLALASRIFDGVVLAFSLHEKSYHDRHLILQEIRRVLRPDGYLVVADYLVAEDLLAKVAHLGVRWVERGAGRDHFRNFQDFMERGGLLPLLEAHGFTVVHCKRCFFGAVAVLVVV